MNLLTSLGEAQRRIGDAAHRETLLEAGAIARRRGDAIGMARAALANSRGTFSTLGRVDTDRVEFLEATIEALDDNARALRARLLATLAAELLWSGDAGRRRRLTDEALSLARDEGDPVILGSVVLLRWTILWNPRWARERLDLATEISAIADATGDPHLRFWGLWRQTLALMELGDSAADRLGQAATQQADDLGHSFPKWCMRLTQVSTTLRSGQLIVAGERAEAAAAFGRQHGQPDADLGYALQIAGVRYEQGRLGELEPMLADLVTRFPAVPFFRAMLAASYCEVGELDAARSAFAPLSGDDPEGLVGDDWFATPTTALLATLAAELGSTGDVAALYEVISPYRDQVAGYPIWLGAFSHHLGRLATTLERFSDAEAHFRDAVSTHGRLGAPGWVARTRLEWAGMLLRRNGTGDTDQARALLRSALEAARDLGLGGVERRAASLLV
jgi:tetratricopeptide (TPR) repeat protein